MSDLTEKDDAPKPRSALSFERPQDPETLSLSDSDPEMSENLDLELISAEEDEDEDDDRGQEVGRESPLQPFSLKGTDVGFSQRSRGIFGALFDVQKGSSLTQRNVKGKEGPGDAPAAAPDFPPDAKEKEEDPGPVASKKRSSAAAHLPDYLAHPERWTKYSLEDVQETSDRANRNTALNFLAGLKHQREGSRDPRIYNQDSSSSGEGRILFAKPQKKSPKDGEKSGPRAGPRQVAASWGDDGPEDAEGPGEQETSEPLGFHGVKKRSRKNIRPKGDDKEEEDAV